MVKQDITFTNLEDLEETRTFYFNLTDADIAEIELNHNGDLSGYLEMLTEKRDFKAIIEVISEIILSAYGKKTDDGEFYKNQQIRDIFKASDAYSQLLMSFVRDLDKFAVFLQSVAPLDARKRAEEMIKKQQNADDNSTGD